MMDDITWRTLLAMMAKAMQEIVESDIDEPAVFTDVALEKLGYWFVDAYNELRDREKTGEMGTPSS